MLRLGKPLIVVPNPTLLDNHQEELASKLDALGHLRATSVSYVLSSLPGACIDALGELASCLPPSLRSIQLH